MCLKILINERGFFALSGQWQERKLIETRELELTIRRLCESSAEYKDEGGDGAQKSRKTLRKCLIQ